MFLHWSPVVVDPVRPSNSVEGLVSNAVGNWMWQQMESVKIYFPKLIGPGMSTFYHWKVLKSSALGQKKHRKTTAFPNQAPDKNTMLQCSLLNSYTITKHTLHHRAHLLPEKQHPSCLIKLAFQHFSAESDWWSRRKHWGHLLGSTENKVFLSFWGDFKQKSCIR